MSRKGWSMTKLCMLLATALLVCLVLGAAPVSAAGTIRVDGDAAGCVGTSGQGDPYGVVYCKIQDAVTDAGAGDTIHVYPRAGVYDESVNLSGAKPDRDLTVVTVNNAGTPTPGTVTVDFSGIGAELYTNPALNGDLTIDGFVVHSAYPGIEVGVDGGLGGDRNVVIRNVTATETESDGIRVSADGNVTISNCIASDNDQSGIHVARAGGDVVITDCTANNNTCLAASAVGIPQCQAHGIAVVAVAGQVKISDSTANGNGGAGIFVSPWLLGSEEVDVAYVTTPDQVTITDSTTNGNGQDGVFVGGYFRDALGEPVLDGGDVIIRNCTANGNDESGFDPEGVSGTLSIEACIARDNEEGVDLDHMLGAEAVLVNGNIICGNECGVYLEGGDGLGVNGAGMNLEGNWWGCAGGPKPEGQGCDPICEPQEGSILVDFTPWISKTSASATVDPATAGQPTVVSFEFSGGPPAVYLGQGPGDLRGPAPFTVTTDNGTLNGNGATVQEFINAPNGTLQVTLVPDTAGTATVTVSGPCGLADLDGATAVLGVESEFVPEPGSVLLLGSGLMGLAGYAGLRLRKR